ncbi:MAG: menaquinone biosynthesis protein [Phycisphaerales bacterium]|nr:menaquinone biosynthesis protein [Phycisphaerales bacterium]
MSTHANSGGTTAAPTVPNTPPMRVGVVSYLNTLPLIDGLDDLDGLELRRLVPSLLADALAAGDVDVALCSSIDYLRSAVPLALVPVGMLGSHGETLTVRLYSQRPIAELAEVHCDTDSHTSVALLQIVLNERYGVRPRIVDYNARERTAQHRVLEEPEAMLLIGDKVVVDSPPAVRYPHQLDLGAEWLALTGLPFVFAVWMARRDADPATVRAIAAVLDRQRRHNRERLDTIVHRRAATRSWPRDLADRYLKQHLRFDLDEEARRGLELFHRKAHAAGLAADLRPLESFPLSV